MSRAARFTQADVARALAGVKAGGERPAVVDILPDGRIRVLLGGPAAPVDLAQESGEDWSAEIAAL
jgi:hypothetical protein